MGSDLAGPIEENPDRLAAWSNGRPLAPGGKSCFAALDVPRSGSSRPSGIKQFRSTASFDHLIGAGEQRGRDRQAERFGSLEIDRDAEPCRLLERQVCRA